MNSPKFISLFSFWLIINSMGLESTEQMAHSERQNQTQLEACGLKGGVHDPVAIKSRTVHPFIMSVLPGSVDKGVSKELQQGGMFDAMVLGPFQFLLQTRPCDATSIVADVGANVGFFSFFSLSMKCRVLIFEPQQRAGGCINATLCLDRQFAAHADFFNMPVSNQSTVVFPVNYKEAGNTGGLGSYMCAGGALSPGFRPKDCNSRPTASLDGILGLGERTIQAEWRKYTKGARRLRVLKVDTEGFEFDVLDSAALLLSRKLIDNILFEVSPVIKGVTANLDMFRKLADFGYAFAHLPLFSWRHVSNYTHPFHARIIPLGRNMTAVSALLNDLMEGVKVPKWRGTFQTDIWASLDETQFDAYNKQLH